MFVKYYIRYDKVFVVGKLLIYICKLSVEYLLVIIRLFGV